MIEDLLNQTCSLTMPVAADGFDEWGKPVVVERVTVVPCRFEREQTRVKTGPDTFDVARGTLFIAGNTVVPNGTQVQISGEKETFAVLTSETMTGFDGVAEGLTLYVR